MSSTVRHLEYAIVGTHRNPRHNSEQVLKDQSRLNKAINGRRIDLEKGDFVRQEDNLFWHQQRIGLPSPRPVGDRSRLA